MEDEIDPFLPRLLRAVVFITAADKTTSVRESRLCQGPVTTARELSASSRQLGLLPGDGAKSQCHRDARITWLRLAGAKN